MTKKVVRGDMTDSISLDSDAAAQAAAAWRNYGDLVEAHGRQQHMTLEQLQATVGDTYAPFVAAKHAEMQERQAAYQRVAEHARGHAERLSNTRTNFNNADDESAARINNVVDA
ncbi:hypothetical protein [Mycolicibacterium frederiksbergense]|uniref:ESX-1 secretion-associated protein n=1 Tax=Mycolicibacterium frederiksbergense TaxID=117567 RepID=A0A6H0RYD7_9MYCO|nr:hypothetical protein [Mycolicibacterium frederiksbergense]QIV79944.1 hypothetical protein EXE63_02760 [Mycolicibacterium frederiksbergense]